MDRSEANHAALLEILFIIFLLCIHLFKEDMEKHFKRNINAKLMTISE